MEKNALYIFFLMYCSYAQAMHDPAPATQAPRAITESHKRRLVRKTLEKKFDINAPLSPALDVPLLELASCQAEDNQELIKKLLAANANVAVTNKARETPLHRALIGDAPANALLFINHIAAKAEEGERKSLLNLKDGFGRAPIHYTALKGYSHLVPLLVKAGADIDDTDVGMYVRGDTALHLAASERTLGNFDARKATVIALCVLGAKLDITNRDGQTAANLATHADYYHHHNITALLENYYNFKLLKADRSTWFSVMLPELVAQLGLYLIGQKFEIANPSHSMEHEVS